MMLHHDLSGHHQHPQRQMSSPVAGHEPMVMGSPSSPQPGHSQYLPGFLLGDHTPQPQNIASPVASRLWSSGTGSSPGPIKSSILQTSNIHSKSFLDRKQETPSVTRSKDKMTAPPIHGLRDTSLSSGSQTGLTQHHSFIETLDSPKLPVVGAFSTPLSSYPTGISRSHISHSTPAFAPSTPRGQSMLNSSTARQQLSPTQVDPFYTQGESLSPYDKLDETWVTVFGFSPAASNYVLSQFSQYGTIIKHIISNEGNWMHLHYQSKIAAKKALSKNGKVIGNNIMVGVTLCLDRTVTGGTAEPCTQTVGSFCEPTSTSHVSTPIRPLTAAYKAATTENEVIQNKNLPKKQDGIISKAMEYIFGW